MSAKHTCGPHGLGDPDDKSLRKVEAILIEKKVREVAYEKCMEDILKLKECIVEHGLLTYKCKEKQYIQSECLQKWYRDKELYEQKKKEYLEDRSEYRATGIPKYQAEKRRAH